MPTDIQFKHELRKQRLYLKNKLELLENQEYEKLKKVLLHFKFNFLHGIILRKLRDFNDRR